MGTAISSIEEIQNFAEQLRAQTRAAFAMVYCGDGVLEEQWDGVFHMFPAGAITPVEEHFDWPRDRKGRPVMDEGRILRKGGDAASVAGMILERCKDRGLVPVFYNKGDEERMKVGRQRYLRFALEMNKNIQSRWLLTCEQAAKTPGSVPPRQSDKIKKAIKWLETYESGILDRKPYIAFDGAEFDSKAEVETYLVRLYSARVNQAKTVSELYTVLEGAHTFKMPSTTGEPAAGEAAAPTPAAPEALEVDDLQVLIEQAEKYSIELTRAEYAGAIKKDEDTIGRILQRIATKKVASEKEK